MNSYPRTRVVHMNTNHLGFCEKKVLIQWILGPAREYAFLRSSCMMLMLLIHGPLVANQEARRSFFSN